MEIYVHDMSPTTHTVEMEQILELNQLLAEYRPDRVTAKDLGLEEATTSPVGLLPGDAVLVEVRWDGPPEFPYVHGAFSGGAPLRTVMLHTHTLRELSHLLHAHHIWGVGSVPEPVVP